MRVCRLCSTSCSMGTCVPSLLHTEMGQRRLVSGAACDTGFACAGGQLALSAWLSFFFRGLALGSGAVCILLVHVFPRGC